MEPTAITPDLLLGSGRQLGLSEVAERRTRWEGVPVGQCLTLTVVERTIIVPGPGLQQGECGRRVLQPGDGAGYFVGPHARRSHVTH